MAPARLFLHAPAVVSCVTFRHDRAPQADQPTPPVPASLPRSSAGLLCVDACGAAAFLNHDGTAVAAPAPVLSPGQRIVSACPCPSGLIALVTAGAGTPVSQSKGSALANAANTANHSHTIALVDADLQIQTVHAFISTSDTPYLLAHHGGTGRTVVASMHASRRCDMLSLLPGRGVQLAQQCRVDDATVARVSTMCIDANGERLATACDGDYNPAAPDRYQHERASIILWRLGDGLLNACKPRVTGRRAAGRAAGATSRRRSSTCQRIHARRTRHSSYRRIVLLARIFRTQPQSHPPPHHGL